MYYNTAVWILIISMKCSSFEEPFIIFYFKCVLLKCLAKQIFEHEWTLKILREQNTSKNTLTIFSLIFNKICCVHGVGSIF